MKITKMNNPKKITDLSGGAWGGLFLNFQKFIVLKT